MVGMTMNVTTRGLSTDVALHLLADRRRRAILELLREREEAGIGLDELVSELADGDGPADHHSIDADVHTQIALTHSHLPKLADYEVVTFHRDGATVTRGPAYDAVEPVLSLLESHAEELPSGYLPESIR